MDKKTIYLKHPWVWLLLIPVQAVIDILLIRFGHYLDMQDELTHNYDSLVGCSPITWAIAIVFSIIVTVFSIVKTLIDYAHLGTIDVDDFETPL